MQGRQVYFALFSEGFSAFGLVRHDGRASSNQQSVFKIHFVFIAGDFTTEQKIGILIFPCDNFVANLIHFGICCVYPEEMAMVCLGYAKRPCP